MEENQISRTALLTAYSRGYHAEHDSPKIFDDFLANQLLTEQERRSFDQYLLTALRTYNPASAATFPDEATTIAWMMQGSPGMPIVLSRARYTEESLEEAIRQGTRQYVILGAGLDTFAFRRPDLMAQVRVFEVDHHAMQSHKRRRLAELGWEIPSQLQFVEADFTRDTLAAALAGSSYDPNAPTFFNWLGVTYYLSGDAVHSTLRAVADVASAGSKVVFDYLDTDAFIPRKVSPRVMAMLMVAGQMGEVMQSGFDPLTLDAELVPLGLRLIEDLSPLDIHGRYFLGRTDHYRACEHAHIACAVVE